MDMAKPKIRFKGYTDEWEQRKLGDFTWDAGKRNKEDLELEPYAITNEHGFIRQRDAHDDFGYMKDTDRKAYNIVQPNSFAYNPARINVGSIGYYKGVENVIVSSLYEVFQTDNYVNDRFLWHWLKSDEFPRWIEKLQEGSVRLYFYYDKLCECQLYMPSLEEQEKIASFLDGLDHLITLHQRKCEQAKKLKKYMLQKMFPQNGQKVPEIRFKGFTDDWEQRKLGEIITEYKETVDSDCTLPILTSSKTEGVILQEEHFGRKQQHDITGYNILPRNYCTYRNRSDGVDFTFNINKCCDKGIISKFYPVFSGKNSDVFFLSLVLNNSDEVVREIAYTCTGTGQKVLSFLDLQKMKVRVPNFDEQKEIAAYFESLDHLITLHQQKCDELKNIKKFMLQNMFM